MAEKSLVARRGTAPAGPQYCRGFRYRPLSGYSLTNKDLPALRDRRAGVADAVAAAEHVAVADFLPGYIGVARDRR